MKRRGFTIVEIVIIIAVIGILVGIASLSFASVQRDTRDSQREATVNLIAKALERYHDENGEYPSVRSLVNDHSENTGQAVAAKLGLKPSDLKMPGTPESITNPLSSSSSNDDQIIYEGDDLDWFSCVNSVDGGCFSFMLTYKKESGETVSVESIY